MSLQTRQTIQRSLITFLWSAIIFGYFSWQFDAERRFTYFFINKAVAESAIFLIAVSYFIGPLCRLFPKLARQLAYRKFFGLAGFSAVVFHIVFSLLQWTDRFGWLWYVDHAWGVSAAIIATFIFSVLAATSTTHAIVSLGSKRWKTVQRFGYTALLLASIHVAVASWDRWNAWWDGDVAMPSSFVVFIVIYLVFALRFAAYITDVLYPRFPQKK